MSEHDNIYLKALLENDQKGVKAIYDNYLPRIEAILRGMGCSKDNAWEIFQESLIVIMNKARQQDFVLSSSFYTFLVSVSKYKWFNYSKKKYNNELTIEGHETLRSDEDIEQNINQIARYRLYKAKLSDMSPICRQILELFLDQNSLKDITEKLNLTSENATKQKKHQCQKKLISMIQSDASYKGLL